MPGKLYTWGYATNGSLGNGTTTPNVLSPAQIGSDTDWAKLGRGSLASSTIHVIKDNGTLWGWGPNSSGQIGDGTTTNRLSPVQIGSDTNWNTIASGGSFTVALKTDGTLWSWGNAGNGRLGNGTTTPNISSPAQVGSDSNWAAIATGVSHALAIKTDGTLWAWGANANYELGDGTNTQRTSPVQVGADSNWESVSAGENFTLAIKTTGTLWAWGQNSLGRTGRGTTSGNTTSPTQVGSKTNWALVAASSYGGHGVDDDGKLWGWGYNVYGNIGDNSTTQRTSPVQVGTDTDWLRISSGGGEGAGQALKTTGTLWAWGRNDQGQTGDGTTTQRNSPVQVGASDDWIEISRGGLFSVAIEALPLEAPQNTAAPSISGTAQVGETLTTTDGTWTGNPTPTYTYQWKMADTSDGSYSNISGATSSTFTLTSSEAGKYIKVEVTATNSEGSDSELSSATSQVLQDVANTALPTISSVDEVIQVGSELTSSPGTWEGAPEPTFTYQWQLSDDGETPWTNLSGATASSLTVPSEAGGKYLRLEVVATNSEGSATAYSTAEFVAAEDEPEESGGNKSTAAIVGALRVSGAL